MSRTTLCSLDASSAATPSASMTSYGGEVSVDRSPARPVSYRSARKGDRTNPLGRGTGDDDGAAVDGSTGLGPLWSALLLMQRD